MWEMNTMSSLAVKKKKLWITMTGASDKNHHLRTPQTYVLSNIMRNGIASF